MLVCKTCDAEVGQGQLFCVNCGARTEGNTYESAPQQPTVGATISLGSTPTVPTMRVGTPAPQPGVPAFPAAPGQPQQVGSYTPSAAGYGQATAVQPTSTTAVVSMVFGILGLSVLPLLGSLVAVVAGHMARREIRDAQGRVGGDGMAIAGLVMGYIVIVSSVLLCGLFAVLAAIGIAAGANF